MRGVFWLIDEELLAVPYDDSSSVGIAKSGNNYNHKLLWCHVNQENAITRLIIIPGVE